MRHTYSSGERNIHLDVSFTNCIFCRIETEDSDILVKINTDDSIFTANKYCQQPLKLYLFCHEQGNKLSLLFVYKMF